MNSRKKNDIPLSERICRALDVLPESVSSAPYLELHGRSLLKLRDGGRILLYTKEKIKIALPNSDNVISVIGNSLSCSFYNLGAVGIEGCIEAICFFDPPDGFFEEGKEEEKEKKEGKK